MMDDSLSHILDIDPISTSSTDLPVAIESTANTANDTITDDAVYARENIRGLIDKSVPALHNLMKVANDSQHPRAYEVVTQFVKAISDLNKDLMEIHKKEHEMTKSDTPAGDINVKNAVFVGTTKELREHLKS